jgi:hypothetical protein
MPLHQRNTPSGAKKSKRFTELYLDLLKYDGKITYYWDVLLPAFGVRVTKTRKTFTIIPGKRRERITVGHYQEMPLKEARKKAVALLGQPERSRPATPFQEALDAFIEKHVDHLKSGQGIERTLRKHCTCGLLPVPWTCT